MTHPSQLSSHGHVASADDATGKASPFSKYHWDLPEKLDHHWGDLAKVIPALQGRYHVLDTSSSGRLRPDLHVLNDCLHLLVYAGYE